MSEPNLVGKRLRLAEILKIAKNTSSTVDELVALTEINLGLAHRTAYEYVKTLLTGNVLEDHDGKLKLCDGRDLIKLLDKIQHDDEKPKEDKWFRGKSKK